MYAETTATDAVIAPDDPVAQEIRRFSLPDRTQLPPIADEAFDRLAALVRRVIGVPVALVSLVDRDGQVFPGEQGLPEPWSSNRCTPLSHSFCQHVVIDGSALVISDARLDPRVADNLAIEDLRVIAYAGIPISDVTGRVVGSLCAIDHEPRVWKSSELAILRDLAAAVSAELQLRDVATRAAVAYERAGILLELTEALSGARSVWEVTQAVERLASSRLGTAFAGVAVSLTAGALPTFLENRSTLGLGPVVLADLCADLRTVREPRFYNSLDELAAERPGLRDALREAPPRAVAYLPLVVGERCVGAVLMSWPTTASEHDRDLLQAIAHHTAQAVDRTMLLSERRDAARTLQSALLPSLPDCSWLELAGTYLPAHVTDAVGGDWYDAVESGDSVLTVSVGDVAGHDAESAATMGQVSAYLRGMAVDRPDSPAGLLSRLDRLLAAVHRGRLATATVANLRPYGDGYVEMTWSSAGHLPPLLLAPGCAPELLTRGSERLLGLRMPPRQRTDHRIVVPPGSTLLFYTDGLIERRRQDILAGMELLGETAARVRGLPLQALIEALVLMVRGDDHDDDTIVFGVRVPG